MASYIQQSNVKDIQNFQESLFLWTQWYSISASRHLLFAIWQPKWDIQHPCISNMAETWGAV